MAARSKKTKVVKKAVKKVAKKGGGKKAGAKKPVAKKSAAKKAPAKAVKLAPLPQEWSLMVPMLGAGIASLKKHQYLILASVESHRFVQFAADPNGTIRGEVVSDHFLDADERLTTAEKRGLAALKWAAPTHADDAPKGEVVKDGSPNWYRDFNGPTSGIQAAAAAAGVLWQVFHHRPGQVRYNAFTRAGDELTMPITGILPEEEWMSPGFRPDSVDDLREMVLETLKDTEVGTTRLVDGVDLAVDIGERSVFIVAHDEPLSVLLYSVVGELDESADALKLVNDLNRSRAGSRAILYDGHLLVDRVLPGDPFVPRQLIEVVVELVAWANAVEHGGNGSDDPSVN